MKDDVRLELNETQSKNSSLSAQIEELTTERDSLKQTKASLEKDVKEARFDRKEAINSEDELSTKYDEETEAYTKDVQLKVRSPKYSDAYLHSCNRAPLGAHSCECARH